MSLIDQIFYAKQFQQRLAHNIDVEDHVKTVSCRLRFRNESHCDLPRPAVRISELPGAPKVVLRTAPLSGLIRVPDEVIKVKDKDGLTVLPSSEYM